MQQRFLVPVIFSLLLASCGSPAPTTTYTPLNSSSNYLPPTTSIPQTGTEGTPSGGGSDYKIKVVFVEGTDARVQSAVRQGVARWERILTKTTGQLKVDVALQACGNDTSFSGNVTDLLVYAGNRRIDGPGGTLAKSGPCLVNSSTKLPVVAMLIFDTADLPELEPQLTTVATHELAHSLGFGSLWTLHGLVQGAATEDPRYIGAAAKLEYAALGGTLGNVPLEAQGGEGTAGTHWREKTFGSEMMTGYLNPGSNPLSRLSIAALQDLGYSVDFTSADSFSSTTINTLNVQKTINYATQIERPQYQLVK